VQQCGTKCTIKKFPIFTSKYITLWTFVAICLSVLGVMSKCFRQRHKNKHEHFLVLTVHQLDVFQTTFRDLDLVLPSDVKKEIFLLSWATARSEHSSL
jgi:hypothetical protein